MMVPSYVASMPESAILPSFEKRNKTSMLCHLCETNQKQKCSYSVALRRSRPKTKAILPEILKTSSAEVQMSQQLDKMSSLPAELVHVLFPFWRICYCVDLYSDFRIEPLHYLFLGINCLHEECILNAMNNNTRDSGAVKTITGTRRSFESQRGILLTSLKSV